LGVSHPFTNHHTQMIGMPLHGPNAPKTTRSPINRHISWTDTPHPWVHTHYLMLFLVSIFMTLHGCDDGVVQPLWCTHATKGRRNHYSGVLPHYPTLTKMKSKTFFFIAREEGLCPLGLAHHHRSPRCSYQCPYYKLFPNYFLPSLCSLYVSSLNLPKVCGFPKRPYILPH
jgi:hypothetical protein